MLHKALNLVFISFYHFKKLDIIASLLVSKTGFGQGVDSCPSLPSKNRVADSLHRLTTQIDFIKSDVHTQVDSVGQAYQRTVTEIQSLSNRYQQKIDSLIRLKLPTHNYTQKIDSLNYALVLTHQKATVKIQSIKRKATEYLNSLQLPTELNEKISQVTGSLNDINLPSLPDFKSPVDLTGLNSSIDRIKGSTTLSSMKDLPSTVPLSGITGKVNDATGLPGNLTEQAGQIQQHAGSVMNVVNQPIQADKLIEGQLSNVKEVGVLQNVSGELPMNGLPSEEETKRQLIDQAKEIAVDHFAGKEKETS